MNHEFRQNYTPTPDTGLSGPYTHTHWQTHDVVLVFLSGICVGVAIALWLNL